MNGHSVFKIIGWVIFGVIAAVVVGFLLGLAVMYLWNWLMPELFGLPQITYWQAVGLFILCHLLFKSHSGHEHHSKNGKKVKHPFPFKAHIHACLEKEEKGEGGEEGISPLAT